MQLNSQGRLSLSCCALVLVLSIAGCTSPATRAPEKPIATDTMPVIEKVEQSPESLLLRAQQMEPDADPNQVTRVLLDAATAYLQREQPAQAQHILLSLISQPLDTPEKRRAETLIAQSYMDDPSADTEQLIDLLMPLAADVQVKNHQLTLLTHLYERQQNYLTAAASYAQIMTDDADSVERVWQWVNKVPASEIKQQSAQYSNLQPYVALYNLVAEHGLNTAQFNRELKRFSRVYRGTPLVTHLPEPIVQAAELRRRDVQKATVMLPLSGRYKATGMAVKDGILAAYYDQLSRNGSASAPHLTFIDTNGKSGEELINAIGDTQWIIGPLLKETLDLMLPTLPRNINLLALNRPDDASPVTISTIDSPLIPEEFAVPAAEPLSATWFALAPEDEAYQLADHIAQKGYRSPIVVAANSTIYQRLLDAFESRWQRHHSDNEKSRTLNIVTFDDSGSLKDGITDALGVAQSKSRIDQIRYMVNEKLHNVTRNRRDIDAIVVFASPEQTELLNPMVEASLSPFDGKTVPVYTTSRSMEYDSGKNQWRDLQNVRFIDMPWMLPQNRWPEFTRTANTLWPDRSTAFSRFFAFGVDAYQMLPNVEQMALLPQVSLEGLTGKLFVDEAGRVIRTLPQARINNQQIIPVTGE